MLLDKLCRYDTRLRLFARFNLYIGVQSLNEYTTPATDDQFANFRITDSIPSDGNGGCKYIIIKLCKK